MFIVADLVSLTGRRIHLYRSTVCDSLCFVVLMVFQWTQFTVIHTFLSSSLRTDIVDSMELEHGVTTTAMSKELPRLKSLASFLQSTWTG